MGMRLFHITDKVFEIGDVIRASDFGTACYYHLNNPQYAWINDVLDAEKDAECPPRKRCIYAFDKLVHCFAFNNKPDSHCYLVDMDAYGGFPMVLTDKMRRVGQNYERLGELVKEYWHPTREWLFNEYLGEKMIIIEDITPQKMLGIVSKMQYNCDREMADRLFR